MKLLSYSDADLHHIYSAFRVLAIYRHVTLPGVGVSRNSFHVLASWLLRALYILSLLTIFSYWLGLSSSMAQPFLLQHRGLLEGLLRRHRVAMVRAI